MKITQIIFLIFFAAAAAFISFCSAVAWEGYDYENRGHIDIGPGNLVREGLTIQFYDVNEDDYHTGKVLLMESEAGGVRIVLYDLDAKQRRIFLMKD